MAMPNLLTDYKLSRARGHPAQCLDALARTGMRYEAIADRSTSPGCGFDNAVRLRTANVRFGPPLPLSCPMALSFFMWETHALQPAAERYFGERVAAVEHLGGYACRDVNSGDGAPPRGGASTASRSRHATANALDIAGFTLQDGKRITLLQDWNRAGSAGRPTSESLMLAESHRGACRFFDGVLGPDYNAVHRNHLHLETGGFRMCR